MTTALVIGAHGRTGALVVDELLAAGHTVTGTVRRPEHADALQRAGAGAQLLDLLTATTENIAVAMTCIDVVVYTAGSSYGSSRDVVSQVDGESIIRAAEAAVQTGVDRFVLVSAHCTDEDFGGDDLIHLLRAKRAADAYVRSTPLGWTIIRPDTLTEGRPTGRVQLGSNVPHGVLSRADLARLIRGVLDSPSTARRQFEVIGGNLTIRTALESL
jgi:uncharacterized protein YbjT (DUF2867 family)